MTHRRISSLIFCICLLLPSIESWAGKGGIHIGFRKTDDAFTQALNIDPKMKNPYWANASLKIQVVESNIPANIMWPGDKAKLVVQFENMTGKPLALTGEFDIEKHRSVNVDTTGAIGVAKLFKIKDVTSTPLKLTVPANGVAHLTLEPNIPEEFGGYFVVADIKGQGRFFVAGMVRALKNAITRRQFNTFTFDDHSLDQLERLGVFPNRTMLPYKPTTDPDVESWWQNDEGIVRLRDLWKRNMTTTVEFGHRLPHSGSLHPLDRPRPHLDNDGRMLNTKSDFAWMPQYDKDWEEYVYQVVSKFGWPKGPINGVMLFNEPWEGMSISGWGADMIRYREMYAAMVRGTRRACKDHNLEVLVGGCDSSSNTFDKLYPDNKGTFDNQLDFLSIHYQGNNPGSTIKYFKNMKGPYGRVKIWDTESWVANTEDNMVAMYAGCLSFGYERIVGVCYYGSLSKLAVNDQRGSGAAAKRSVQHAWPVNAGVAAANHFLGERKFNKMEFANGLPWVMSFDGLDGSDDGTIVVVGDLPKAFRGRTTSFPFWGVDLAKDASFAIADPNKQIMVYDTYGNAVARKGDGYVLPLNGYGFYVRGNGDGGSYQAALSAVRSASIKGIEPLDIVLKDMRQPITQNAVIEMKLTNVLNKAVSGTATYSGKGLTITGPKTLSLKPHETKTVVLNVSAANAVSDNTYPVEIMIDCGNGLIAKHAESLHVNLIAKRSPTIDGKLDDWKGVLAQSVKTEGDKASMEAQAWFPFAKLPDSLKSGFATGYLAYDDNYFYFAAKVADSTVHPGVPRFETLDHDFYFYPKTALAPPTSMPKAKWRKSKRWKASFEVKDGKPVAWPEGVRRYSYRRGPDLPSSHGAGRKGDNIQIAFNAIPAGDPEGVGGRWEWEYFPKGTMPNYVEYRCTDYEYALNTVAPEYGGGSEVWRLRYPDMPLKHFYPRQPKSKLDGAVKGAKLVTKHEGNTRITECAIPWSELPHVKALLDAGKGIKFSFRVNDNAGRGTLELAKGRSVSKANNQAFRVDWSGHWANEVEFAFEK